ncbi:hypothetical protein MPTK1_2g06560 [Marchantia polymorpha subsp. ruderalis]|uniref:F-box domain-containing protein n=1 Tax=Marchantia polymorpha TaxID=3197 RepID=A0A2R6XDX1_MARPO|nr:hypothetical protein MARPO_0021s0113 [Marchantia polymorpha]BBN01331.1 hypothetical protein Mp_2g06560 [Marchantia polymorpha subsp. ruderalis]|eukprot:PTQ44259.1 hypothetical protein MARPO_0021s0113 [Marchantia polymorpha]
MKLATSRTDVRSMGCPLPDDLLHNVLGRLPLKEVMRFRCVCKAWNALLMTWEFSHSFCHKPGKLVPLYLDDGALTMYNSSTNSWLQCDLHHVLSLKYHQVQLVASGGGLLCFLAKNLRDLKTSFVIYNPLTRQHLKLLTPFESGSRFCLTIPNSGNLLCGIDANLETGFYRFVFLDPRSGETYLYDSRLLSWRLGCKLPSSIRRLDGFAEPYMRYSGYTTQCLTKEGKFYWLVSQTEGPTLDLVYIYDASLDTWSYVFCRMSNQRTALNMLDERTTYVRCMEHNGEIIVVGKRGRRLSNKPFCYFEILDTGPSNLDSTEGRRLYLQEKAMPMNRVLDVILPLQIEGTQEFKLSWCVGARDEVFFLLEAQSFDLSRDPNPAARSRDDFPLTSPMVRYAEVDDSWTLLCNWKIVHDRNVSLGPSTSQGSRMRAGMPRLRVGPSASNGVWAFQPSFVSPGAVEVVIKHPHGSNEDEFISQK